MDLVFSLGDTRNDPLFSEVEGGGPDLGMLLLRHAQIALFYITMNADDDVTSLGFDTLLMYISHFFVGKDLEKCLTNPQIGKIFAWAVCMNGFSYEGING